MRLNLHIENFSTGKGRLTPQTTSNCQQARDEKYRKATDYLTALE